MANKLVAWAPIFCDGIRVGTITCGPSELVSPFPLGNGFAFGPAPSPSEFPQHFASREMPGRDFSHSPGSHATPSHGNQQQHRRLGHPHATEPHEHHKRFLTPENRGNQEREEQQRNVPLPKEKPDRPIKVPHGDAAFGGPPEEKIRVPKSDAAFGGEPIESTFPKISRDGGDVDRSRFASAIDDDAFVARMASMVQGEVGLNSNRKTQMAITEQAFNRWDTREQERGHDLYHGRGGYYAAGTFQHVTPEQIAAYKENILKPVLAGSDVIQGMTGNASNEPGNMVAAHQFARGTPGFWMSLKTGEEATDAQGNKLPSTYMGGKAEAMFMEKGSAYKHPVTRKGNSPESTIDAERPNGPAAPAHVGSYHDDLAKARQANIDAAEKAKNKDLVEKARHFELPTPDKKDEKPSDAKEPIHGSPH
jgi:hypothetical protein